MNTENQNIDFLKTDSLNFRESNPKVDKKGSSVSSAFVISNHKERYEEKTDNSNKETGLSCSLILPKDNTLPAKVEINQLAKTWCELLLNQMQETHDKPLFIGAFDPNLEENKYRGFLINH